MVFMRTLKLALSVLVIAQVTFLVGCGPDLPDIVPVKGQVTINGKALPHARIEFFPLHRNTNSHYVATDVSDDNGNFELAVLAGQKLGACACECKVVITDGPIPEELREMGQQAGKQIKQFKRSLKNRPIPADYQSIGRSPLRITPSIDKSDYPIEISR